MPADNSLREAIDALREDISEIKVALAHAQADQKSLKEIVAGLITRPEFTPVKLIVYGMAGSILTSVLVALVSKVITK